MLSLSNVTVWWLEEALVRTICFIPEANVHTCHSAYCSDLECSSGCVLCDLAVFTERGRAGLLAAQRVPVFLFSLQCQTKVVVRWDFLSLSCIDKEARAILLAHITFSAGCVVLSLSLRSLKLYKQQRTELKHALV